MVNIIKYLKMYNEKHPEHDEGGVGARIILYADESGHFEKGTIKNTRLENFDDLGEFVKICKGTSTGSW